MVQGVNSNNYGSIIRVGNTQDNRVIYEVKDPEGNVSGKLSVAQESCDTFERSYNTMMTVAPKVQAFTEKSSTPEWQEHSRKVNQWSRIGGASIGLLASAFFSRKLDKYWVKALICIPSTIVGLLGGAVVAAKTTTPKEAVQFSQAVQAISKLDIQPYNA